MKLLYAILCNDIIVDRESGAASFIKTFEHGVVRQLPAQVPPFFLGTLWELDPASRQEFTISMSVTSPSGKTLPLGTNQVKPTGAALHKINFHLPGLKVEEEGRHVVSVGLLVGGKESVQAELPLFVLLRPAGGDTMEG
ncbi:MAG: hypothetical protein AB7D57_14675 [Desulfovibrionaceae bacterium]